MAYRGGLKNVIARPLKILICHLIYLVVLDELSFCPLSRCRASTEITVSLFNEEPRLRPGQPCRKMALPRLRRRPRLQYDPRAVGSPLWWWPLGPQRLSTRIQQSNWRIWKRGSKTNRLFLPRPNSSLKSVRVVFYSTRTLVSSFFYILWKHYLQ